MARRASRGADRTRLLPARFRHLACGGRAKRVQARTAGRRTRRPAPTCYSTLARRPALPRPAAGTPSRSPAGKCSAACPRCVRYGTARFPAATGRQPAVKGGQLFAGGAGGTARLRQVVTLRSIEETGLPPQHGLPPVGLPWRQWQQFGRGDGNFPVRGRPGTRQGQHRAGRRTWRRGRARFPAAAVRSSPCRVRARRRRADPGNHAAAHRRALLAATPVMTAAWQTTSGSASPPRYAAPC